jgi:hypothetical protein
LTIGTVESVAPDEIKVLLELDAPQSVALNSGQPVRFPRINGYVLIPNEAGSLVGMVTWMGIERSAFPKRPGLRDFGLVDLPFPLRKMLVVPLGTLVADAGDSDSGFELRRGAIAFPSVGDAVLLPTTKQIRALVEAQGANCRVDIGRSPLGVDARVSIDPDKLFGRHVAILGNTGSGKSCSVAGLIRWSLEAATKERELKSRAKAPNARFIVLDPNGEYRETFSDLKNVRLFQVEGEGTGEPLRVPAWMWNSHEWSAFTRAAPGTQRPLLLQALRNLRAGSTLEVSPETRLARLVRGYNGQLAEKIAAGPSGYSGKFGPRKETGTLFKHLGSACEGYASEISKGKAELAKLMARSTELADAHRFEWGTPPVVGYNDFEESELLDVMDLAKLLLEELPDVPMAHGSSEDAPVPFDPADMTDHLEVLASSQDFSDGAAFTATLNLRVRAMLADTRLAPIVAPEESLGFQKWIESYLGTDDDGDEQVTVLDLSMVPADVLHVVVAVIARLIFEALQRYRRINEKELPTVLVLEEAHSFIRRQVQDDSDLASPARMCRETFERIAREGRKFGLGLVNDRDQDLVAHLVPDNLGGLLKELPSLPSQQAVLLGWAAPIPVLMEMRNLAPEHRPKSADPKFWDVWTGESPRGKGWTKVVEDWTGQPGGK